MPARIFRSLLACVCILSCVAAGPGCRSSSLDDLVAPISELQGIDSSWKVLDPSSCGKSDASRDGHVVFRNNRSPMHIYRMAAHLGAKPEDVSAALDRFGPGRDVMINIAQSGNFLLVGTTRFGCGEEECFVVLSSDYCRAQIVVAGGYPLSAAPGAISSDGNVIVYATQGNHPRDLFVVRREGQEFGEPFILTAALDTPFNEQPVLSEDGKRVLFDCGSIPYSGPGTAICEIGTDGTGFRKVVTQAAARGDRTANHHAAYAPDGSIVFEGTWNGKAEQVWRFKESTQTAELINGALDEDGTFLFADDNSPCVLPDGRIVSLWLGRPGNDESNGHGAGHELKIMNADGNDAAMLLTGIDVLDVGIGCGP